jgi:integrase/recombinase XerD
MRVILRDIPPVAAGGRWRGRALVSVLVPCLVRLVDRSGGVVVRLGVRLLDEYLEFLAGRCRPNTVLAVAYELKVFFAVVGRPVERVEPADVLGFVTAQRSGGDRRRLLAVVDAPVGVSARTVRRRLSSISGL